MKKNHLISETISILEALKCINSLAPEPLVLFVMNNKEQMVGTLTDGDVRRSLIKGSRLEDRVSGIMHRDFNFLNHSDDIVSGLHEQRELKMQLVPILDKEKYIIEIIDLSTTRTVLPIDAVLMAGGKGVRLRPLTEKTPKPLLPVGGKAIIDHNVDRLISFGVKHISVTVNYLGEQIEEHYANPRNGIKVETVREPQFLGTIGSIHFVKQFHNDTVLVMNSDLFTDVDYEDFYLHFRQHNADMSVAAVPYTVSIPYGIMDLDGRDLKGLIEKPRYNYYANAGIYLIKKECLKVIPDGKFYNATDMIEDLIKQGSRVIRYPITGNWIDIGNPQEYQKACDLAKHIM